MKLPYGMVKKWQVIQPIEFSGVAAFFKGSSTRQYRNNQNVGINNNIGRQAEMAIFPVWHLALKANAL